MHTLLRTVIGLLAIGLTTTLQAQTPQPSSVTQDTLVISSDSVLVITTACAPLCASVVTVYDSQEREIGRLVSPFPHAVFAEAYIEDRKLKWRDNTPADWDKTY